jgi:hypothetical protein
LRFRRVPPASTMIGVPVFKVKVRFHISLSNALTWKQAKSS